MIAVALLVASLPGAVGRIAAFGIGPLLLCTAGLVLLCLLRSPLRWSGARRDRGRGVLGGRARRCRTSMSATGATWSRCAAPRAGSR